MKRRSFIKASSIIGLPIAFGGVQVAAIAKSTLFNGFTPENDKVLVMIQLNGGNDGLNTLIPLDQYENLLKARENILIPKNKILGLTDMNGLHPSMVGMQNLFNDGKLNIIQNVGYPNQNRSHFRSTDIWQSGSSAEQYWDSGWMGRYLDTRFDAYPDGYPNEENPDPFAITMGYTVSETCQGINSNFSIALTSPEDLKNLGSYEGGLYEGTCYGNELDFVRLEIQKTNAYSEVVLNASEAGNNLSTKYNEESELAQQLKIVARLISGGIQTKVFIVKLGGFDTHSVQVDVTDVTKGNHADLLLDLSDSIAAFQNDIELLGIGNRVVGMTYSEFGRKIKSNFSFGTDHGTAAPLFVFGQCVNPSIVGDNPDIISDVDPKSGVAMQYDFRSVYGSLLMDWFGATENEVKSILFEDFQYINILNPCMDGTGVEEMKDISLTIFPNPAHDQISLKGSIDGDFDVSIYDVIGHELRKTRHYRELGANNVLTINISDLISGQYFLTITGRNTIKTLSFVKD